MGTGKGAAAAGAVHLAVFPGAATFHLPVMLPSWACAVPVTPPFIQLAIEYLRYIAVFYFSQCLSQLSTAKERSPKEGVI